MQRTLPQLAGSWAARYRLITAFAGPPMVLLEPDPARWSFAIETDATDLAIWPEAVPLAIGPNGFTIDRFGLNHPIKYADYGAIVGGQWVGMWNTPVTRIFVLETFFRG